MMKAIKENNECKTKGENTDKSRLGKLLNGLETPDIKLPEKCSPLVKEFREKYSASIAEEESFPDVPEKDYANPFIPNQSDLEEIDNKIMHLIAERRGRKPYTHCLNNTSLDPKRPWRTNTSKEKLLRINNELRRHNQTSNELIQPLTDEQLSSLLKDCSEDLVPVDPVIIKDVIEQAKKNLPNFNYREKKKVSLELPILNGKTEVELNTK